MADTAEVSLRPLVLKPGGLVPSNPFASFGKGAGFSIKTNKTSTNVAAQVEKEEKKKTGPIIRYSTDFLMKFMEQYTKCPAELQGLQLEIVISEEEDRNAQRQAVQQVVEEIDDRDWRTRAPAPAPTASTAAPSTAPAAAPSQTKPQPSTTVAGAGSQSQEAKPVIAIQKAADIGREAYKPGAAVSGEERALRQIKGILNKLTPEKFERLLGQLLEVVISADILKHTITLVFENAVAQPTFCAMYADLCLKLSAELPSFPPPEGEDKPMSFTRILLNTCQDEFEGAEQAREVLKNDLQPEERELAERRAKQRMLGTVRLISELYKKAVVKEKIMLVCVRELLSKGDKGVPPEDNIEAVCEMLTIAGGPLAQSPAADARKQLDGFMARLQRLSDERALTPRTRFLIRDVLDMKKTNWTPRRETFTAKKLEEVRAEAEAELGMISSAIAVNLPTLPSQQRMAAEEFALLPPLKGDDGWEIVGKKGAKTFTGSSALVGEYQPLPKPAPPAPAPVAAPITASVPEAKPSPAAVVADSSKSAKGLSEEDLQRKAEGLFQEFCSVGDQREAVLCAKELQAQNFATKLPAICLKLVLDSVKATEQSQLQELLVQMHKEQLFASEDLENALKEYTSQLEDVSLDAPKAPALLGRFYGLAVQNGALALSTLASLIEGDYGVEYKRKFAAAALQFVKEQRGESALAELCTAADIHADELFKADPEFDADACSVAEFLDQEGLKAVPL